MAFRSTRFLPLVAVAVLAAGCSTGGSNNSSESGAAPESSQTVEEACVAYEAGVAKIQELSSATTADADAAAQMTETFRIAKEETDITNPEVRTQWDELIAAAEGIADLGKQMGSNEPDEDQLTKLNELMDKGSKASSELALLCDTEGAQS